MGVTTAIGQWLTAERGADEAAKKRVRRALVAALWETFAIELYDVAKRCAKGQQSDIRNSAFKDVLVELDQGAIEVTTRQQFRAILCTRIFDKAAERHRKAARRQRIMPIVSENVLAPDARDGHEQGLASLAVGMWAAEGGKLVRPKEPHPEFGAMIDEMLDAVPEPRDHDVLFLKIQHLIGSRNAHVTAERSNAEIAREIGVSDKEVGRSLERVRKRLEDRRPTIPCASRVDGLSGGSRDECA